MNSILGPRAFSPTEHYSVLTRTTDPSGRQIDIAVSERVAMHAINRAALVVGFGVAALAIAHYASRR